MMQPNSTGVVTSADGTQIAFEASGEGAPVILVDGAMCFRGGGPMRPLAELLSRDMLVIAYDRRGRGESSDTLPYDRAREVEDLAALIDAVGGRAALYAISSGVALALEAAAALGEKVTRLALYEPPYSAAPDASAADYSRELERLLAEGRRADAIALFMRRVGVPEQAVQGIRFSPTWPATEALAPTLAYDDRLMGDGTMPLGVVTRVAQPCLVMAGEASPPFLREAAERLAEALPDATYRALPGQTHDVHADVLAPELAAFLS
jgi:pimeloyl-ACP methyl ester carboxylesterase